MDRQCFNSTTWHSAFHTIYHMAHFICIPLLSDQWTGVTSICWYRKHRESHNNTNTYVYNINIGPIMQSMHKISDLCTHNYVRRKRFLWGLRLTFSYSLTHEIWFSYSLRYWDQAIIVDVWFSYSLRFVKFYSLRFEIMIATCKCSMLIFYWVIEEELYDSYSYTTF